MRPAARIMLLGVALLAAALLSLLIVLRYDSDCPPSALAASAATGTGMQAATLRCYGSPEVLRVESLPIPSPVDDEVLVRVHAASINPMEWHTMEGRPYVMRLSSGLGRPKEARLGVDFAGTVEAVGPGVTRFRPGDEVFGARNGALAEYVTVRQDRNIELKPPHVTFAEAAAAPLAATTALQALRDIGGVQPGQRVLVNGASGGVGTFAVQIARAHGAHVTGVSSTRNLELVRSLGADEVIDYTAENFTERSERWDVIIDNVGNHSFRAYRRVLAPDGILVMVSGPKENQWLGPLVHVARGAAFSRMVSQTFSPFLAEFSGDDLAVLRELMASGAVKPVLDGEFTLAELPAAMEYVGTGRSRGKNVILMGPAVEELEDSFTEGEIAVREGGGR